MNIHRYLGIDKERIIKGDCGIEIEMELNYLEPIRVNGWSTHRDDSLRGASIEWVSKVLKWEDVNTSLNKLSTAMKNKGMEIKNSFRAGVHIHVNSHEKTLVEVAKIVQLYCILEGCLMKYCGDDRTSNLFCLPIYDADTGIDSLCAAINHDNLFLLDSDNYRYSSLNLRSLCIHGTIEFRSLKTPIDILEIDTWVKIIKRIVDYSKELDSLQSTIEMFSISGPEQFVKDVLGEDLYPLLEKHVKISDTIRGLRLAQQIAQHKYME